MKRNLSSATGQGPNQSRPFFMRPLVFLAGWMVLALLFGFQEYVDASLTGWKIPLWMALLGWTIEFLLWGLIFLGMWHFLRESIQNASPRQILLRYLPLSLFLCIVEEVLFVTLMPYSSSGKHYSFLVRLERYLSSELFTNLVIFWTVFALFRGIGYYQQLRERRHTAERLEAQLVQARLQSLQMQLNPHFLFNTLNSVSSLMRADPDGADEMLERLSSLLRITLTKRQAQKIRLQEEMEVVGLYVSIQQIRFGDRVQHSFEIAPAAWDALVPTMILQPIVENAYIHGITTSFGQGTITVAATIEGEMLSLSVRNVGSTPQALDHTATTPGVGIENVKARLALHYGNRQSFSLRQVAPGEVLASLSIPLEIDRNLSHEHAETLYAASGSDRR